MSKIVNDKDVIWEEKNNSSLGIYGDDIMKSAEIDRNAHLKALRKLALMRGRVEGMIMAGLNDDDIISKIDISRDKLDKIRLDVDV